MAQTYIVPLDLVTYYDQRRVLQLASDTGTAAQIGDLSSTSSPAYGFINNCIITASSDLDTHCQLGKRYTRAVLENLIANALANPTDMGAQKAAGLIRQLVADLAFGILAGRRGYSGKSLDSLAPRYDAALQTLERIAEGLQVFDQAENLNAGVANVGVIQGNQVRVSLVNRMFPIWPGQYGPGLFPPFPFWC